ALKARYPEVSIRYARYMYKESVQDAVEELLADRCKTIIYQCFCNPVYSDFEDYSLAIPMVHGLAKGRAKVICADQPGNQQGMREAFVKLAHDNLVRLPPDASLLLILSKHGHPFRKETQDKRGHEYRLPLEKAMRELMKNRNGKWELVWSNDEFADEYWDPRNKKFSTYAAYRKAIEEGYDYALEIPTDFIAENTDLMFLHAMKKFRAFAEFSPDIPVSYPDWEKPLVRVFREGKTTGIYAGCPVGPYRPFVAEAITTSVAEVLANHK
ncbi:MAG: ferrochelatase, partial [Bacteroidales bacterium]|nr:ferrochelatase [Bacteroidales bacterium]